LPFRHPFTSTVSGPMGSGKTEFIMRLVDNADAMIKPTPRKILYYFAKYQMLFERYEDRVDFIHGMLKADPIDRLTNTLIIFVDMMDEANERLTRVFTRGSQHKNVSVIFMVQNFCNKNRHMRMISLNAQYIILFKNPHDSSQFVHVAKQLYPHNLLTKHTSMPRIPHMAMFC